MMEKVQLNDERSKGLNLHEVEDGKWLTVWVSPRELSHILGVKMKWNELGMKMSFSKILRRIVESGFEEIDWQAAKENPLSLFKGASL